VHGGGRNTRGEGDGNLGVVNAGEVAGAGGLVLLRLEREGVGVHTGVGAARVVVVGLHLVEVLTLLGLEAVLAVEDELEVGEGTNLLLSELGVGVVRARADEGNTRSEGGGDEAVGRGGSERIGVEDDLVGGRLSGEVPKSGGRVGGGRVVEAPHELLNGVVVGEALVLGSTGSGHGVRASVLHLLNEVLVTLLGEAAALLGVKVDVVGPDLEDVLVEVVLHVGSEVEINADLVVLEGNEGEVETGVAVEEEDEGEVDSLAVKTSGHLTPVSLLGLIQVKLGVQTPPALVVLVNALTTDGKLRGGDGTLSDPAGIGTESEGVGRSRIGLELEVHVTDEITVAGNSHGDATGVGGSTVDGLLDVLHREVSVALVNRLEESNLRVTSEVHILGTVSDELHKTTGHCESFCTISREKNFGWRTRGNFDFEFSQSRLKMSSRPEEEEPIEEVEEGEIVSEEEEDIELTDEEDYDINDDDEEDSMDLAGLMTSLLATPDGDTICSALVNLCYQLETQNKILIKMLSKMQPPKSA
jgi:hypothetical protein